MFVKIMKHQLENFSSRQITRALQEMGDPDCVEAANLVAMKLLLIENRKKMSRKIA